MSGEQEPIPTELVAGKYRLTRLLGRGGMGSVWEGIHITLGTRVAVKFIESEYADSPDARSRFENEARAAATLQSKYVVQVYDHGVMPDGRPYIVMEFLAGEPLDSRLDRQGRLSPAEVIRIVHQVARALQKAHQAGIVHRDLKPENVFLVWDEEDHADQAKVVDFGIAKFTNASMGVSSSTRTGSVLGTPYYMSPEQARGLRSVDYRSDIWALGVITYRSLVGELPFKGEAIGDLLVKICTAPLPVPSMAAPDLPPSFDAWFARALDREPAGRFPSAIEAAEGLAAAFGTEGATAGITAPVAAVGYPAPGAGYPTAGGHPMGSGQVQAPVGGMGTGAPFNVTPPAGVPKQGSAALILVAVVAVVLVLGAGGLGAAFLLKGAVSQVSAQPVESVASVASPAPETESVADDEPAASPETTEHDDGEGDTDRNTATDESGADPSASASAEQAEPEPAPAASPAPAPSPRVVRTATPRRPPPRPTPTPPPRTPTPAPTTPSRPTAVDVGY